MTAQVLWEPTPETVASSRLGEYLRWLEEKRGLRFGSGDYGALWQWSVDDLPGFWQSVWDHFEVASHAEPSQALADRGMPGARWFPGATLNYAENALRGPDNDIVIVAESQTRPRTEISRGQLREAVARAAAGLRRLGVGPGDRVAGYLPNIPEAAVALLATASIGAVWASCAPEFGTQSVLDRFRQVEPKVLIAVDGYRYGDKPVDRTEAVRTIRAGLPSLTATVTVPYLSNASHEGLSWGELIAQEAEPSYEPVPFGTPLWIMFSSGTTGLPKAIVHSHGGIVLEMLKAGALQLDLGPGERYFVYCTTSWVMWNILVSTSLLTGATAILSDGDPTHPDAAELWRVAERTGATVFGCGAAYLMACRTAGLEPGKLFDLSRLRLVSSTGSPLPAEGYEWVYEAVSVTVRLESTSGGTDVASAFVAGSPMLPVRAGVIAGRALGVRVDALGPDGSPLTGELGELVVSAPMPCMPVFFWNDPGDEKYLDAYFRHYPGAWRHGDWIRFDEQGGCVIGGRSDGTLNRGGVRLGTSEFYAALEDLPEIDDSLVVHLEDPSGGLGRLLLFVQLAAAGAELDEGVRTAVVCALRERLSPRHVPDEIHAVPAIPYNLTGKKLEVPVKRLLQSAERDSVISDGAVRDPDAFDPFERLATRFVAAES